ncbi:hypothetical protein HaLaN_18801 [Haematococcus lacustris]|uniref:Uncharacterized protein n=1 Tax=Haematococcus lacustris TaxID=44745 RepID=A0A699ZRU8_HAELA|nr:hypothetical protein HaLaN_18801 [Haematococcus lacustris]
MFIFCVTKQTIPSICDVFTLLFFYGEKERRTVPRPVPEDPDNDILDRDEALQPDHTDAQRKKMASGEARAARDRDNTYHDRKCKLAHITGHLPQELWNTFLVAVLARGEACSERAVIGSLLLGFLVRDLFTLHVADPLDLHGQPVYTYIPLCRGLPGDGENTRPSAAVAARLAAHTDLRARLEAVPRYHSDTNMVDHVGKQLETACSNMLTLLFAGRLKKSVVPDGADGTWYLMGTEEHQRRFGFRGLGGASVVLAALHLCAPHGVRHGRQLAAGGGCW